MKIVEKIKHDERINLRLKPGAKKLIERAASFEGKNVSHFILNCALERAEKTVQTHEAMTLNSENSEMFLRALAEPVTFNSRLSQALSDHSRRVTSK